ncbi:hypothetical protein V22_36550 [Calycomorphotria hydatis]|uniref:WD40-like Beta Propeller Repeat protein n=1 Tax=Calycomorphotria hydatis TaxID=2528027 RepID=A0A517TDD5_9PLAN|nr:hypothetical protein V22_36550 [Calycomorphotria hydatis]
MKVEFINCQEVRMGSPYKICDLKLEGKWVPVLPDEDWQDVICISPCSRFVGLVAWDTQKNEPGFIVYTIDIREQKYSVCDRMSGCCSDLTWDPDASVFIPHLA